MNQSREPNGTPHGRSPHGAHARGPAFTRSPFALPATMVAAAIVGAVGAALIWPRRAEAPPRRVVLAPSVAQTAPQLVPPTEEAPAVIIRPLPEKAAPQSAPARIAATGVLPPSADPHGLPAPATVPGMAPATRAMEPAVPEPLSPVRAPEEQPTLPVEAIPRETPRSETPRVETPPVEPEPPRRRRIARAPLPRPSGRLSIYFDADSSTFDQGKNRAPLRVEVYVGGRKVMETNDPEKREFDVADLPEGVHEVSIVPHVGDAQPRPRRFRVEVDGNAETRVEAVLRRRDGEALVGKIRARD